MPSQYTVLYSSIDIPDFFIGTKTNSCIPCGLKWKQKLVVEKKGGDEMCKDRWMEKVKTRLIWEY